VCDQEGVYCFALKDELSHEAAFPSADQVKAKSKKRNVCGDVSVKPCGGMNVIGVCFK
jgi:hypothetical protein